MNSIRSTLGAALAFMVVLLLREFFNTGVPDAADQHTNDVLLQEDKHIPRAVAGDGGLLASLQPGPGRLTR